MNETDDADKLQEFLKAAKLAPRELQIRKDLWPRVLTRVHQTPFRVTPLDWVLTGVVVTLCLLYPEVIPVLVCHL